ncbi:MAG: c-type cytochrome [Sphingobacteriales bacterium]
MKIKSLTVFSIMSIVIFGAAILFAQVSKPWPVPDKYVKMKNPVKSDVKSLANGKKLFIQYCQDCHGKKGKGDGTKATDIKTPVADLTSASVQSEADGSLFYKISEGRNDMPRAKKDLPDPTDIWALVNYVRTLKKVQAKN